MQKEDFVRILIQTLIKIADDMSNDIPGNVAIMGAAKRLYAEHIEILNRGPVLESDLSLSH